VTSLEKTFGLAVVVLLVVMGLGLVFHSCSVCKYESRLAEAQNQVAERDRTIEIQKGLYTKLTVQSKDVQGSLDQKDAQVRALEDQIKKSKQELLDASTVVVMWKKAYEGLANASQTTVPPVAGKPPGPTREKVDFHEDFGYVRVDGWTLTSPPQAWVRLTQGRPLRLTLAVSQDAQKVWHTYATSSEENVSVDIRVTSVNPYVLQPRWYEHIGLAVDLGVGTNQGGVGALVGLGANYQFMKFTLGPHIWLGINDRVDRYYGIQFEWRPFQRN
jgi:uncharacterized coiled-coil protein SlyX